jgi:putative ABC transport system substrate-binding protein
VAIVVAGADPAAVAAKRVAQNVPIVFAVGNDPVALGLVTSLGRPGGNATGLTILAPSLEPKRLGLLREILPPNATIGVLLNPMLPLSQKQAQAVHDAASSIKLAIQLYWARDEHEITDALNSVAKEGVSALMVGADPFFDTHRTLLTTWANDHKLPTMQRVRGRWRPNELWDQFARRLSASWRLHRANFERRKTSGIARFAAHQV